MKKNAEYISLFPNVMLGIHKDHPAQIYHPFSNRYRIESDFEGIIPG